MKRRINIFQIVGVALILCSMLVLAFTQANEKRYQADVYCIVKEIENHLPQRRAGNVLRYSDSQMPVLQINGEDFLGLLEIPMQDVQLPIYSQWEKSKVSAYPCRFWGSAYDSTLIVGGVDAAGQMDFLTKVDIGDSVIITDMTGAEFLYEIEKIERSKTAMAETLYSTEDALILFAREKYGFNYVIVRCTSMYE